VRSDLDRLLREVTLTTLAFGIALGWSLFQAVQGVAYFITTLLQRVSTDEFGPSGPSGDLSWQVGNHVLQFGPLLRGFLELAAVLLVIVLVRRRAGSRPR
jgi:hypothetical protein